MKLNRQNILKKTANGIAIYAYVLDQHFPDREMQEFGIYHCFSNPFYKDYYGPSLYILPSSSCARHQDAELETCHGDAFEFAQQHFGTSCDEELFFELNNALNLGLELTEEIVTAVFGDDDFWFPEISLFGGPIHEIRPRESISLSTVHEFISHPYHKKMCEKLRAMESAGEQRKYKASRFPYVTFSGVFRVRKDKELLKPSGLVVFDFDNLPNVQEVKEMLLKDDFLETELLFVSPSGNGLKWVVRNRLHTEHRHFFKAVAAYLLKRYDLRADPSGKDISRACFMSYDPDAFLHERHMDKTAETQNP